MSKSARYILGYMKKEKKWGILFFLLGGVITGLNIAEPLLAKELMDAALGISDKEKFSFFVLLWLGVFFCKHMLMFLQGRFCLVFMLRIMETVQMNFFRRLMYASFSYFNTHSVGYILSRHTNDFFNLEGMMLNRLIDGVLGVLQAAVVLFFMFRIHAGLGLLAMLLKSVDLYSNYCFPLKKLYKEHNEAISFMEKELQDVVGGISLIKSGTKEEKEAERYQTNALRGFYDTWRKRDEVNLIRRLLTGMSVDASYIVVIAAGGWLISSGLISVGEIMAFLLFYQKLGSALYQIIPVIPLFQIGEASAERLYELMEEMGRETGGEDKPRENLKEGMQVSFLHVNCVMDGHSILKDVNLEIRPGEVTALVGRSGSGKTTVTNLLMRFIEPERGEIFINGRNILSYPLGLVRRSIAYLPQEPVILQRTLRENICYHLGEREMKAEEVLGALRAAFAEEILGKGNRGLDTPVEGLKSSLSGGEMQRLCVARELLKDGAMYIFDESTSSLDALSDKIIQETARELAEEGKTVLMITHRLSGAAGADKIYVLDGGKILEAGTHEMLMEEKGLYYRMYKTQEEGMRHEVPDGHGV